MKIMKRTVSVFLAILMLCSCFSVLASAAVVDGYGDTITFNTKFYRNTGTEEAPVWTETTKAAPGESIRARFFIDTDFVFGASTLFFLYSKNAIVMDPTLYVKPTNSYSMVMNTGSGTVAATNSLGGAFDFKTEAVGAGGDLVDFGNLPEDTFDNYGFAYFNINSGKGAKWSGDEWMFELHYKVADDPVGNAQVYMPVESVVTATDEYNNWDAAVTVITRIPDRSIGGTLYASGYQESYDWDPVVVNNDKDEDSTLTFDSNVTFDPGEGSFKVAARAATVTLNGIINKPIDATQIPEVIPPANKEFVGWVPSGMAVTEENAISADAITHGFNDTTYTAAYKEKAATTANYTVNVYEMGIDGTYPTTPTSTDNTKTGNIDEDVIYTPELGDAFYLDAAQSTPELKVTVAADGSSVINAYLARKSQTVKYVDEEGNAIDGLGGKYYYGATYTTAPEIPKTGYDWAGWTANAEVEVKPAADGDEVTYTAAYTPAANKVVIKTSYVDAKVGGTVELEDYVVSADTGYTIKTGDTVMVVNEIPADDEKEEGVVYVLKSALPAADHYEVNPDEAVEYSVAVADDGTASLSIAYISKVYTVTFLNADDGKVSEETWSYYDTASAPEAPILEDEGKEFVEWAVVEGEGEALAEFASFPVEGNITYKATYKNIEYGVFYASEEINGEDAPTLEELGLPEEGVAEFDDEIVLPDLTNKVTGYEFLGYEVIGADYDETTRTVTVGADGVDIIAQWDRIEYTISFYLSDDTTGEPYETAEYFYGDTVAVPTPDQNEILGQKFLGWTYTPALVEGAMPAEDVVAVMDAEPYVVTFYNADGSVAGEKSAATITADYAAALEAAATPENTTFVEWRDAADNKVAFPVDVTGNMEVYAYCTAEVIFEIGEDEEGNVIGDALSEYEKVIVGYGEKVDAPAVDPEITGYNFVSWTSIPATITANTTIVGSFAAKLYTATFNAVNEDLTGAFADGEVTKEVKDIPYNSEFTFDEVPALEGYTFSGWAVDGVKVDTLVMDEEGKTYTALYTMNGAADFTIELYLMDTEGNYGTEPDKVLYESGLIGVTATIDHEGCQQYVEDYFSADTSDKTNNVYKGVIVADGSTTLKLYYKRATVKIAVNGEEPKDYFVGQEIPAPTVEETPGYELDPTNPWVDQNGDPVEVPYTVKAEGNPTEIIPNIVPADNTYTVELYLMDKNGEYGEPIIKTESAKTEDDVSKTHADYAQEAWFSADLEEENEFEGKVAADGSTTLKLYYKRAQYEVTVDGVKAGDVFHGATFKAPSTSTTTAAGYELASWNNGAYAIGEEITVNGPLALTADNVAAANTYKVEIYLMDTEGNYGAAADTDTIDSVTGAEVSAAHADYAQEAWFSADTDKSETEGTVAADGSTTLKLYYKRAQYEVTVDGVKAADVFHGATFTAPSTSTTTAAGYELASWNNGAYAIGEEITVNGPLALTADNVAAANTYKVEIYLMDTEGNYGAAADTDIIDSVTGAEVSADHADYAQEAWFSADTEKSETEGTVAADGSTTLKLYYKRATVKIAVNGEEPKDYFVGQEIPVEDPTDIPEGYEQDPANPWVDQNGDPVEVPYTVKAEGNPTEINPNIVKKTYDVVFKINDSVYASSNLEFDTPITSAGTPAESYIPEGYSFLGWSTDGKTVITDFGTVKAGENIFLAVLEINKYDLSFVVDGEVVEGYPVEVEFGAAINAPKAPDKSAEGLVFTGWVDADDESKMPATMPAKDATYKATYGDSGAQANYTVEVYHMDVNGKYELSATTTLSAHVGETVDVAYGNVTGFTFSAADSVLSGKVAADGSTVLKVSYARNLYVATFDGVNYDVYFGATLPTVEPAAQAGKKFIGWTPAVPGSMPAENLTFTSEWEDVLYTITYYINGETKTAQYAYGATIETPEDPSVIGMTFIGWSDEIPDTMPENDLIFVAEFEASVYNVTFCNADGSVFEKKAVQYGDEIILPTAEPTLDNYVFVGWDGIPADGKMPARDVKVTPIFERVKVMLIPKNDTCTTVIDRNDLTVDDYVEGQSEWYIYGLTDVLKDEVLLAEYIDVQGDGRIEIVYRDRASGGTQAPWTGTGTVINVYDNETDELVESFTIVIFGDLNGDSFITSTDCSIAESEVFSNTWSDDLSTDYKAYMVMACDFDKNEKITSKDTACVSNYALGVSIIDQTTGKVIDL